MDDPDRLPERLRSIGLPSGVPVLVVVGGAGGMTDDVVERLRPTFADVAAAVGRCGGVAVDGGTDAGVMRLLGDARRGAEPSFPLVGVAARGTVAPPGRPATADVARIDVGHTHLVLVPGGRWGDESPWIARVATVVAGGAGSMTLLADGGDIAYDDAEHSLAEGRSLVVVDGSGRTADDIARAVRGDPGATRRARVVAASGRVTAVPLADRSRLTGMLTSTLRPRPAG